MKHYMIKIEEINNPENKSSGIVNQYEYEKIMKIVNSSESSHRNNKEESDD